MIAGGNHTLIFCHVGALPLLAMTEEIRMSFRGNEVTVGIRYLMRKGITDCHIVEAQDTMFHFLQAENSTSILASPLPKKLTLFGDPIFGPSSQ